MTAVCPICHRVATEITLTEHQATYRNGCQHIVLEWVTNGPDAGKYATFRVNEWVRLPQ